MCDSDEQRIYASRNETPERDDRTAAEEADMSAPWPEPPTGRNADLTVSEQEYYDGSFYATSCDKLQTPAEDEGVMDLDDGVDDDDGAVSAGNDDDDDNAAHNNRLRSSPSGCPAGVGSSGSQVTLVGAAVSPSPLPVNNLISTHDQRQTGIDCDIISGEEEGIDDRGADGGRTHDDDDDDAMESQQNECLSNYDGDETLIPAGGGHHADGREEVEEEEGWRGEEGGRPTASSHLDVDVAGGKPSAADSSQIGDSNSPTMTRLTLDIKTAASSSVLGHDPSTAAAGGIFKVPESPATACKHNFGGGVTRGRKTSLTGISTGSNGSNSSGVSSMTSEPFDAAAVAAAAGKCDVGTCLTLDLAAQRRTTGSTSSFSLEEEDANDLYSRLDSDCF